MGTISQELIEKINTKLGGVLDLISLDNAQKVCDKIVAYNIISDIVGIIISLIFSIISLTFIIRTFRKNGFAEDSFVIIIGQIIGLTVIIISLIVIIGNIYEVVMWVKCPEISILKWIK